MDAFLYVLRRGLWLCVCAGLPVAALAQCFTYQVASQFGTTTGATASAACSAQVGLSTGGGPYDEFVASAAMDASNQCAEDIYDRTYGHNHNSSYAATQVPGVCDACAGHNGERATVNFTGGWSHVPSQNAKLSDLVAPISSPGTHACVKGCNVSVDQLVEGFHSDTPEAATGLYRVSFDFLTTGLGTSCTADAKAPNNPSAPDQPCDGYAGTVNGVQKCIPPAGGGASAPSSGASEAPANPGNPAAGSDGAKPVNDPTRSPPDGTGGNGGGPPNAAGGSAGGGVAVPGTGASGGGSPAKGTDGKNVDGGQCQLNPSAAGCGGAPSAQPSLYTPQTKTISGAITTFSTTVQSSPLGSAISGFFTVSGRGSCPTWSLHVPFINSDSTIDAFCTPFASSMLAFMKVALLCAAGFMAFRIAVDN